MELRGGRTKQQYEDESNQRLKTVCLKKIDTTMIGALDVLEKEINEMTSNNDVVDVITIRDAYSRIRSKILDNGNNQKRGITEEFKHYDISWKQYNIVLPVKQRNGEGNRNE